MYWDKGTTAFPGSLLKRAGNNRKQPERLFKTMISGFLLSENRGLIVEIIEIMRIAGIMGIMGIMGIVEIVEIVKIMGIMGIMEIVKN